MCGLTLNNVYKITIKGTHLLAVIKPYVSYTKGKHNENQFVHLVTLKSARSHYFARGNG
jgi:hypothetical protein